MITVATLLWDANESSRDFSRGYDEDYVNRLLLNFAQHLTVPFRFVLFTDRFRKLPALIEQQPIISQPINYGACIEPFRLNVPMILCGLDTIVVANIDHYAKYCLTAHRIALPVDPGNPHLPKQAANGVVLCPGGQRAIYDEWRGENDMEWLRTRPHHFIDDLFPGEVVSYKHHVKENGGLDERMKIVYFHGWEKPHNTDAPWIRKHWGERR